MARLLVSVSCMSGCVVERECERERLKESEVEVHCTRYCVWVVDDEACAACIYYLYGWNKTTQLMGQQASGAAHRSPVQALDHCESRLAQCAAGRCRRAQGSSVEVLGLICGEDAH